MEIEKLARKLAPLAPEKVRRWLELRPVVDQETKELIDRQIFHLARQRLGDLDNKLLLSLPPKSVSRPPHGLHLGTVLYDRERWPAAISQSELLQNMAIFGRSGAGKTNMAFHLMKQLMDQKIPFLFLDWKRTARHLLPQLKKRVSVFTPGRSVSPLSFSPFSVPPNLEPRTYVGLVVDILGDAYSLGDGSRSLLQKALSALYDGGNLGPKIEEILDVVGQMEVTQRSSGWKTSALRALESLNLVTIGGSKEANQVELAQMLVKPGTIIELNGLNQGAKRFLVPAICLWLYYALLGEEAREKLRLVVFVEEAHHVLYGAEGRAKETVMEMLLRQCREIGIGMVVIDQHAHLVSSAALGNTYTTICFNQKDPKDMNKVAALCLLDGAEKSFLSRLPVGQAVVKLQDRWRESFLIQVPQVDIVKGAVTDSQLSGYVRAHSADSGRRRLERNKLDGFGRIPLSDSPLGEVELAFLEDVVSHLDDGVRERYRKLGWSSGKGNRVKAKLVGGGWLEQESIPVGLSRKLLLRLSIKAMNFLGIDAHGTRPASLAHEYWKRFYAKKLTEQGYRVKLEAPRVGGHVDVLGEKDGEIVGVEIETGKSDVVSNVLNCLRSRFERVLVVATNGDAIEKVGRQLATSGLFVPNRVTLALAGEE